MQGDEDTPVTDTTVLPTEAFKARVKIQAADGHIIRVGRVDVHATATQVVASKDGQPLRQGEPVEVQPIGQQAWVVRMADGERWTIMGGGCGCRGG